MLEYLSNQRCAERPKVRFLPLGHLPYCPFLEGVTVCGRRGTDDQHIDWAFSIPFLSSITLISQLSETSFQGNNYVLFFFFNHKSGCVFAKFGKHRWVNGRKCKPLTILPPRAKCCYHFEVLHIHLYVCTHWAPYCFTMFSSLMTADHFRSCIEYLLQTASIINNLNWNVLSILIVSRASTDLGL